jgi:leucyl aminopeptidase
MTLTFADTATRATPLHVIDATDLTGWLETRGRAVRDWAALNGFRAKLGQGLLVPSPDGGAAMALAGVGDADARTRTRFPLADAATGLPEGTYAIASSPAGLDLETECLGWLLSTYRFERYRAGKGTPPV